MAGIKILDYTANAGKGDSGLVGFQKLAANVAALDWRLDNTSGMRRKCRLGGFGDSITGYNLGTQNSSGIGLGLGSAYAWAIMRHYRADILIDSSAPDASYVDEEANPPVFTVGNGGGGFGYAEGGRRTARVLTHQIPRLLQRTDGKLPDIVHFCAWQNNGVTDRAGAVLAANDVKAAVLLLVAMGIPIILEGPVPFRGRSSLDLVYAIHWFNDHMRNWSASVPGVYYLDVLDVLKEKLNPLLERPTDPQGATEVRWRDEVPPVGQTGLDSPHMGPFGGQLMAPILAPILRRLSPEYQHPTLSFSDYNKDKNEYGNFFGGRGLCLGTGGTFNGSAVPEVPEGWRITVDTGATLTPSIVTLPDGKREFRLTSAGGTPTADGKVSIVIPSTATAADTFEMYGLMNHYNSGGFSGASIGVGGGHGFGSVGSTATFDGYGHIVPGRITEEWSLRSPRGRYFSNNFGGEQRMTLQTAFIQGVPLLGSIGFRDLCHVKTDNY